MTDIDIDAIEARAAAATAGPWVTTTPLPVSSFGSFIGNYWAVGTPADGYLERFTADVAEHLNAAADAEFAAHARTDIPELVAEVRRLRPRVLSGDIPTVTAALDALPVGSVVICTEQLVDEDPPETFVYAKDPSPEGGVWFCAGHRLIFTSTNIARHHAPVTVLHEGVTS